MTSKGFLILEDGTSFEGEWEIGPEGARAEARAGEVVFNTSHSGYEEVATDASYYNQIMVMTAPMQGNYGSHKDAWESRKLWIDGFVALEVQNSARDASWRNQLLKAGIPILTGLDTRKIVMHLRDRGTPWGAIVQADDESSARKIATDLIAKKKQSDVDWVYAVTRRDVETFKGEIARGPRVAILDYGVKENTLRELRRQCSEVAVLPSRTPERIIREWNPDGIMLSNGPGDPADVKESTETVRALLGWKPIFGICMGNQILSRALGASTYKLKFGHRGGNHPVRDLLLNEIYVTSQNHGYAVNADTLPSDARVSHINLNDGTVEGIECKAKKCFSVQYHPESHPGPHDARKLFDYFLSGL